MSPETTELTDLSDDKVNSMVHSIGLMGENVGLILLNSENPQLR